MIQTTCRHPGFGRRQRLPPLADVPQIKDGLALGEGMEALAVFVSAPGFGGLTLKTTST
ncbi:hypothetical protein AB0G06_40150 [Nonomuraea dietziae]|uniref:hypothetical protein n=1 Tax=Nonomuraea dietziae TaxID=65515 RepID=UPI0033D5E764